MQLYVVDAFTTQRFSGNQAGVVLLSPGEDFPAEEVMRALAGELKHSETVFVKPLEGGGFHLRYFTPADEVDLCGHATVAAFTALRERAGLPCGEYPVRTLAGDISIGVAEGSVWMDMAAPRVLRRFTTEELPALYAAYGLTVDDKPGGLSPAVVSTGLADILLPVTSGALDRAVQDRAEVLRLSEGYDVVGFHLFCPDGEHTARCRNFAPRYDIDEEAATGTSNGALTWLLYEADRIKEGEENSFLQGQAMGKPSLIRSRLTLEEGKPRIRVGGPAVVNLKLELL